MSIDSELLKEKYRVQKRLAEKSKTVKEYLVQTRLVADQVAKLYGFSLRYVQISNNNIQPISVTSNACQTER